MMIAILQNPIFVLASATGFLAASHAIPLKPNIIVFYTDDHGYADLGVQGIVKDIKTPNTDALAKSGVRALHGYSTAPQCVPSRAGLMSGRSQNRFGIEANGEVGANGSAEILTGQTSFPARLQKVGYATAQFGKWHLGAATKIVNAGFTHLFAQEVGVTQTSVMTNIDLEGKDRTMSPLLVSGYHLDNCTYAAASLIKRYKDQPFLLYIALRAPHVPLDAPKKYLDRFPGIMPERRRQALAMISAVDDGVGLVMNTLKDLGLLEKTLVFYAADNGAPLKITKEDLPLDQNGWDGSLNDPLSGEKGTLMEGGMHVPFLVSWKGIIPPAQVYAKPIWTLDIAATAVAVAGIKVSPDSLDGVNLIPFLSGEHKSAPHEYMMWRWLAQGAIRSGDWKYLRGGDKEYLFNLAIDLGERFNLIGKYPEIENRLRLKFNDWTKELDPPGMPFPMAPAWTDYYSHYLEQTVPVVTVTPANCDGNSFTLPNKTKVSSAGIYLDTAEADGKTTVNAYVLPVACPRVVSVAQGGKSSKYHGPANPAIKPFLIQGLVPTKTEMRNLAGKFIYLKELMRLGH